MPKLKVAQRLAEMATEREARVTLLQPTIWPGHGYVYCVRRPDTRALKFGYTNGSVNTRFGTLQSANDEALERVFYLPATTRAEFSVLFQFQKWHKRGEWFHSSPEIEDWIERQARVKGVLAWDKP